MAKLVRCGAGVSMAAVGLFMLFGMAPAQAGSATPAYQMFKGAAGQDDALPATINGHVAAQGGKALTTTRIVNDGSEAPFMTSTSYGTLQAAEGRYQQIAAQGGWGSVSGRMKKGDQGKNVAALNRRLFLEGYLRAEATQGQFAQVFTSATEQAVKDFQHNHGLAITGAVDNGTVKELNIPVEARLSTIRANLPRFNQNAQALGSRYVVVNVPAMQLESVQDGKVFSIHNVIVGRPSRPTPVVITHLQTIRFNPYWNAPPSIVERDIVPRMLSGGASSVMKQMNMKVFQGVGGPEINPDRVNWRSAVVDNYQFRQEPGGSNAMATAKIEFNSPFGIYLHDTPEPELFNTGLRFYSSGCVRVQQVATLINWILNGQDGIGPGRISELADTKERLDVTIQDPPQIRVAYLTAWPALNGMVAFRPDIYQMDGSGFVVGQPNPVGDSGPRYTLKPVVRSAAAVDAAEASSGGFFSLFGNRSSGRNAQTTDAAGRELSAPASGGPLLRSKASVAANAAKAPAGKGAAAKKKGFNFFESLSRPAPKTASASATAKKKLTAATAKPAAKGAVTAAAGDAPAKTQGVAPKSAKPASAAPSCKADAGGKLPAGCKPAAAIKAKPKVVTQAASTTPN